MNLSNFYAFSLTGELGESITKESVITLRKKKAQDGLRHFNTEVLKKALEENGKPLACHDHTRSD